MGSTESVLFKAKSLIENTKPLIKEKKHLEAVVKLIFRAGVAVVKYAPQTAKLCACLYGRMSLEEDNSTFEDIMLTDVYSCFMKYVRAESELDPNDVRGLYNF